MSKQNNLTNSSFTKDHFEDLDYEMIPIGDQLKQNSPLFPKLDRNHNEDYQTIKAMKKLLNRTKALELNTVEFHGTTLHLFYHGTDNDIYQEEEIRILLPLKQVNYIKRTKKYTKIKLKNGKTIKTSIPFSQLHKILSPIGFANLKENILRKAQ